MTATGWSDELLASMRTKGDEWADSLIKEIITKGGGEAGAGEATLGQLLTQIVSVRDSIPDDLAPDLKDYFLASDEPEWLDLNMLVLGEQVYAKYVAELGLILLCASLPACYADAPGTPVLYITTQLTSHVERRIIQTLQFVIDVMVPGGLSGSGHGAITAKKVRLIHAANRYILRTHPEAHYDEAKLGCPLNQEDLALTLMTFATTVLDCLAKIEIPLSANEQQAYFHTWRYIGHLMGIVPELLPATIADGANMMQAIAERVYGPSESGQALTKGLIDFLEGLLRDTPFTGFIPAKIRFYMGDEVSDMLAVPSVHWQLELQRIVPDLREVETKLLGGHEMAGVSHSLGRALLDALEVLQRNDARPMFQVPDALRQN